MNIPDPTSGNKQKTKKESSKAKVAAPARDPGGFYVRDDSMFGFFRVDNELIDVYARKIKATAFLVYCALRRLAQHSAIKHKQATIAARLGISLATFKRAIQRLTDPTVALVAVDRENSKGRAVIYVLLRLPKYQSDSSNLSYLIAQKRAIRSLKSELSVHYLKDLSYKDCFSTPPSGGKTAPADLVALDTWKAHIEELHAAVADHLKTGKPIPYWLWDDMIRQAPPAIQADARAFLVAACEEWEVKHKGNNK